MGAMEANDEVAIRKIRRGDRAAFRDIVQRHSHRIFALAYRLTDNEQDAEEIVQDTFLKA